MGDVMSTSHGSYAEWAAKDGRREDLEFHVKRGGPNVLIPRGATKTSLLHEAAGRGHKECVKVLLQYGMSPNVRDNDKKTPLHLAAYKRQHLCTSILLDHGAEADALTRFQATPLHYASSIGCTASAKLLLEHGADINAQESWGQTPLAIAVKQGHPHMVKFLLKQNPDLDLADYLDKQTVLHVACSGRDVEIIRYLLDAGCKVDALDEHDRTPLQLAIGRNFKEAVYLLLSRSTHTDDIQTLKDKMPHRLPLIQLVEECQNGPLNLKRQCMMKIRSILTPSLVDQLPLPEALKQQVKRVPTMCCELQRSTTEQQSSQTNFTNI